MHAWSPLLIQKIEIHALGFVLRKLQLNRHRDAEVAPHRHAYAQLILYLSGEGIQSTIGRRRPARAGDLFIIPAGTPHGFSVSGPSRPLCLVLDYELEDARRIRSAHRTLLPAALNELHTLLSLIPRKGRLTLSDYSTILAVVARLLVPAANKTTPPPSLLEQLTEPIRASVALGKVARDFGYHPDHLSRKLKHESGLSLRDLRDRLRLEAAQKSLCSSHSIAEAAVQSGFEDPNYFARWFRRRTGQSPSKWRS